MNATRKACIKTYCEKEFPKRQKAFANKLLSALKVSKTKRAKTPMGMNKESQETCARSYCNPTCEGTLFEPGKGVPKSLVNRTRKTIPGNSKTAKRIQNAILGLQKNSRAKFFGTKTNVLKNGFFEKLPKKTVAELKKKGAISGCAAVVL